jgi:hypothetical protein
MGDSAGEVLLLLCCLTGSVAFVCFAMGAVENLGNAMDVDRKYSQETVNAQRDSALREVAEQQQRKAELEQEWAAAQSRQSSDGSKHDMAELEAARRIVDSLDAVRRKLEAELHKGQQAAGIPVDRNLDESLKALAERLRATRDSLNALPAAEAGLSDSDLDALKKQIADIEQRIVKAISAPPPGPITGPGINLPPGLSGTTRFSSPLFVECKGSKLIFHPEEETVVEFDNPFTGRTTGHDVIVFFVRPSGMKTFNECRESAERSGLPMCTEPTDESWNLGFSKP